MQLTRPDGGVRTFVAAQEVAFGVQGQVAVPQRNRCRCAAITYDTTVIRLFRTLAWQPERLDLRPEATF
ncbi:hypothetical protein [Hymenobacter sp. B1770]|uniref:hypothetical protein n=1 Tax=Hymenobacter sp. B1770 TaxID=1718788 RepID=UPI003CF4155C